MQLQRERLSIVHSGSATVPATDSQHGQCRSQRASCVLTRWRTGGTESGTWRCVRPGAASHREGDAIAAVLRFVNGGSSSSSYGATSMRRRLESWHARNSWRQSTCCTSAGPAADSESRARLQMHWADIADAATRPERHRGTCHGFSVLRPDGKLIVAAICADFVLCRLYDWCLRCTRWGDGVPESRSCVPF